MLRSIFNVKWTFWN